MQANFELLKEIKKRVMASSACVDSLISVPSDSERFRNLLELSLRQQETACIEMRRLYDMVKKPESRMQKPADGNITEVFGKISVTPEGWVHIKLNFLLPHCRMTGATQYVSDSILRLISEAEYAGKNLPFFRKAFVGILEFSPGEASGVFDHDNKGYKAVQNALKGRLFPDDDCFEMSLGLFTEQRDDSCCHIYVLPDDETGIFTDMRLSGELG